MKSAADHALVLTVTSRLARRVLHGYRSKKMERMEPGWITPPVFSLNRWVKNSFERLWEPFHPLSKAAALRLWNEAVQEINPPEELKSGPSLYSQLQEAFDILSRHRLELSGSPKGLALADWRREVSNHFRGLIEAHHILSWADMIERVGEALKDGRIPVPGKIFLAGFIELSPVEEDLVSTLSKTSNVTFYRAERPPDESTPIRLFATPEQECQSVCAEVLRAWNEGKKRLGIVFLDRDYFPLLKQCLEELTDREPRPADALRYNLAMGTPLPEHPLFKTALLPLNLLDEPKFHVPLSSFLGSPYVRNPGEKWDRAIRASLWSADGARTVRDAISDLRDLGRPVHLLRPFLYDRKQPVRAWLDDLEDLWSTLEFPVCRCETDTLAREHLMIIVEELKKEAGGLVMGRGEMMSWFSALSQGIEVVEKTTEAVGIQVLNPIESRGISFEHLWVVGAHGRALPPPVRELPFLDPEEIRKVEGGTAEGQWDAAKRNLSTLVAAAPRVDFSRAMAKSEDEPYLPCRLFPYDASHASPCTVDLWQNPPAEWLRARWLREGLKGIETGIKTRAGDPDYRTVATVPPRLDVTQLEILLLCPFRFFAGHYLSLEPVEEPGLGIDPADRGSVIHKILGYFAAALASAAPDWPEKDEKAIELLEKAVDTVLGEKTKDVFWAMERLRLLGDGEFPGLLKEWLKAERQRAIEGWRFEAAEESFEGLQVRGTEITLNGRIDRVDRHVSGRRAVWDYKTGDPPPSAEILKEMVRPQLPAYLLSLREGLLRRVKSSEGRIEAGYITLKKASEVEVSPIKDHKKDVEWETFLEAWEEGVRKRLQGPLRGDYLPDPLPEPRSSREGACKYCPYPNLCGFETREAKDEGEDS